MREWWSKLRRLVSRDRLDEDLRAELDTHLQMEVEARRDRGMSEDAALEAARRQFGNRTRIEEASREAWMFVWLETLVQDVRYGLRVLRRSPGFALTAMLRDRARRRRQHRGLHAARSRAAPAASLQRAAAAGDAVREPAEQRHPAHPDLPAELHRLARHELQLRLDGRVLLHSVCRESVRSGRSDAVGHRHRQLRCFPDAWGSARGRPRLHRGGRSSGGREHRRVESLAGDGRFMAAASRPSARPSASTISHTQSSASCRRPLRSPLATRSSGGRFVSRRP